MDFDRTLIFFFARGERNVLIRAVLASAKGFGGTFGFLFALGGRSVSIRAVLELVKDSVGTLVFSTPAAGAVYLLAQSPAQ